VTKEIQRSFHYCKNFGSRSQ